MGLFGRGLDKLRLEAGLATGLLGRNKNPDLAFMFAPTRGPLVSVSVALIGRFCSEIWNAGLDREIRDPAGLSLGRLGAGIKDYLIDNPVPPSEARGPISATHKTLGRAGWRFISPFVFESRDNRQINTLQTCPKKVTKLFKRDLLAVGLGRSMRKLHARRQNDETDALIHNGILHEPLIQIYNKLPYRQQYVFAALVSGGLFTNTDLYNMGYDIDPCCLHCHSSCDTIFHRCFSCPNVSHIARAALGEAVFDELIDNGEDCLASTRCLVAKPKMLSTPSATTLMEFVNVADGDTFSHTNGYIYGDGSCIRPAYPPLARAGWAIVQVDPMGVLLKAAYGTVPRRLEQDSLTSEHCAFSAAADLGDKAIYLGDCQEVVSAASRSWKVLLNSDCQNACIWKSIYSRNKSLSPRIQSVCKTKAHRSESEVSDAERVEFLGNKLADEYARLGALLHQPHDDDIINYHAARKNLKALAYHMTDCLSTMSLERIDKFGKVGKLPVNARPAGKGSITDSHDFFWRGKAWVCYKCLLCTASLSSGRLNEVCHVDPPFAKLIEDPRGHKIHIAILKGGGNFCFCAECFHFAAPHPRKLLAPCRGRPLAYSSSRYYILRHTHPTSKVPFSRPCRVHD